MCQSLGLQAIEACNSNFTNFQMVMRGMVSQRVWASSPPFELEPAHALDKESTSNNKGKVGC